MNEWMNEWMNWRMNEWLNDSMNGWFNEWMNERMTGRCTFAKTQWRLNQCECKWGESEVTCSVAAPLEMNGENTNLHIAENTRSLVQYQSKFYMVRILRRKVFFLIIQFWLRKEWGNIQTKMPFRSIFLFDINQNKRISLYELWKEKILATTKWLTMIDLSANSSNSCPIFGSFFGSINNNNLSG